MIWNKYITHFVAWEIPKLKNCLIYHASPPPLDINIFFHSWDTTTLAHTPLTNSYSSCASNAWIRHSKKFFEEKSCDDTAFLLASTRGVQQLPARRLVLATGQHWNLDILVTRSSTMWNMLVKIPECFVHVDASFVYRSMDLTNDKPSDCKMRAILKDFKWEPFPHPLYSPDLAPCDYHLFLALKDNLGASSRQKLNSTQKFRCSSQN